MTGISHSLDKALANQNMMFDEFDSLSLGGGVHLGRGLVTPRPGPSPRRDKTRHQHFECHHSLLLHIYTIKGHGWMQRLGFFFLFPISHCSATAGLSTENSLFLKNKIQKHKPHAVFFWPVSMLLDHNTVYQSSQGERPVIQQGRAFQYTITSSSPLSRLFRFRIVIRFLQSRLSFDHQHLTPGLD